MSPRRHGILRIGRFSVVGLLNTLVDLAVFLLLVELVAMPVVPANLLAFAVALANSYVLNRLWTFNDSATAPSLGNVSRFVLFNACGALLATAALALLVGLGLPTLAAKLLSIAVSMAWNYLTMRHFVFRPPRLLRPGTVTRGERAGRRSAPGRPQGE